MGRLFWVVVALPFVHACAAPNIIEAAAACGNAVDDDGDGLTDCEDPGCAASGACEVTLEACSNDLDDDGDGPIDCEADSCIRRGFCASRAQTCDWAAQTGCVRGLSCIGDERGVGRTCSPPGSGTLGDLCLESADCQAPALCTNVCAPRCVKQSDCPGEAGCLGGRVSVCVVGCVPVATAVECRTGTCAVMNSLGAAFDDNGIQILGTCVTSPGAAGTVAEGGECADPGFPAGARPTAAQLAEMCDRDLVCFPNGVAGRGVCRATCAIAANGSVAIGCASGRRCVAAFPNDTRPLRPLAYSPGLCIPN